MQSPLKCPRMGTEGQSLLGNNVKVHFAGFDGAGSAFMGLGSAGINYRLYSCFPFIKGKARDSDFRLPQGNVLQLTEKTNAHVIQDSGLFTLMFGAGKGATQTRETIEEWQDKLIAFVIQNGLKCTCVETDCQKVLGVDEAWYFRERMRRLLPNRQINVFHFEDGNKGLDRLIEFSDYIAISVPEWRILRPKSYRDGVARTAHYIKNRKPDIDIHLLGCTETDMLKQNRFCTSADSTSWITGLRYGSVNQTKHHISEIRADKLQQAAQSAARYAQEYKYKYTESELKMAAKMNVLATVCRTKYEQTAGSQR